MPKLPDMHEITMHVREIARALNGIAAACTANTAALRSLTQAIDDAAHTQIEVELDEDALRMGLE